MCRLHWDADEFCDLIGPRGILIVGDSTMQQTASVIMNHVLATFKGDLISLELCLRKIIFGLSDRLIYPTTSRVTVPEKGFKKERGAPVADYISHFQPSTIFLNTGPHVSRISEFQQILQVTMANIRALNTRNMSFVWKSQYQAGCHGENKYNWYMLPVFDEITWKFWDCGDILDVSVFSQAQHMHVCNRRNYSDGTHYCIPGPLDSVPKLLYSLLKQRSCTIGRVFPEKSVKNFIRCGE